MPHEQAPSGSARACRGVAASKAAKRVLGTLLWFGLAGPPIGAVVFAACMALAASQRAGNAVAMFGFVVIYGVPFSYWLGLLPALAAGGLVGAVRVWRGAVGAPLALLVGALVGGASLLLARVDARIDIAASWLATCVLATAGCWWLSGGSKGASGTGCIAAGRSPDER